VATLAQIIGFVINASMFLIVFAIGSHATLGDLTYLFRQPRLLIRSVVSMNVVMPMFAVAAAVALDLPPALEIALVALAISPVPPILPGKQEKAGGGASYTLGLLTSTSIFAVVLVPLTVGWLGHVFGLTARMPAGRILSIVMVSVLVPLVAGIAVRRFAPGFAARAAHGVAVFAAVLLGVALVPVLFIATPALWSLVGNGALVLLVLFTVIGVAVGHVLGGPNPDDRTVLALATGTRHPGVAIAIATINFPDEKAVFGVVIYHLIIGAIVSAPYVKWRTRLHTTAAGEKVEM
jgi:BASS family bile acid:Na+ symporter